jgi:hypothetical protein
MPTAGRRRAGPRVRQMGVYNNIVKTFRAREPIAISIEPGGQTTCCAAAPAATDGPLDGAPARTGALPPGRPLRSHLHRRDLATF